MPQLFVLALIALAMAIPACLLAYIIISFFPNASYLMLAAVSILSVVGLILGLDYLQIRKQAKKINSHVVYEKVGTVGRIIALIFTSLIGVYFVFKSNKIELYVDNQNETEVNISINNSKLKLAPFSYKKIDVVEGKLTLKQADVVKVVEVKDDSLAEAYNAGNGAKIFWVLNINSKGVYAKTDVQYGTKMNIGIQNPAAEKENEVQIIADEFFKVKADFLFDIPTTIKTKSQFSFLGETRTAVYRLKDLENELIKNGQFDEEQKPDYGMEDSVVVKSKKSKTKK